MIGLAYGTYGMAGLSFDEAAATVAEAGYDAIEIAMAEGYPGFADDDRQSPTAISRAIGQAGLPLVAVLLKADLLGRGLGGDELRRAIDLAGECGMQAPVITFTMGGRSSDWPDGRTLLCDRLRPLADIAGRSGAALAVEPHANGLIDRIKRASWLMGELAHPAVRLNFDVSHYALPGADFDLDEAADRLLDHSVHVHIKDSIPDGDGFRFVLPGEGALDLASFFAVLQRHGWQRPVTVEVSAMVSSRPGFRPREAALQCFRALDRARRAQPAVAGTS